LTFIFIWPIINIRLGVCLFRMLKEIFMFGFNSNINRENGKGGEGNYAYDT
jgi:hypothetical protein